MRARSISRWVIAAAFAAAIAAPSAASAQEAPLALNRFHPAPAGDRMFGVQSPYVAGHLTPHFMLLADYAHNPLVLRRASDSGDIGAVVGHQLFLHVNGSFALWDRVALNVDLPIALLQKGDSPQPAGANVFESPSDVQLSDLRLGLRVRLIGDYFDPFQLAVGGYVA